MESSVSEEEVWPEAPTPPKLVSGSVHVWQVPLGVSEESGTVESYRKNLSSEERLRADGMQAQTHRGRFIISRGVLRRILCLYMEIRPESLKFEYLDRGKPMLPGQAGDDGLQFNLSHSRELTLIGVTVGAEIGVDVEYVRDLDRQDRIAERFFSAEEIEAIQGYPDPERREAFFSCWTRKEAYLKGLGAGLGHSLSSFSVSVDPNQEEPSISGDDAPELTVWSIRSLYPEMGYVGAVARKGEVGCLQRFTWPHP